MLINEEQFLQFIEDNDLQEKWFITQSDNYNLSEEEQQEIFYKEYIEETLKDNPEITALVINQDISFTEAYQYIDDGKYLIYTEDQAEDAEYSWYNDYIEDVIMHEIPDYIQAYFDTTKYIEDQLAYSDRGSALAPYDGMENYETVFGETYYIYRQF